MSEPARARPLLELRSYQLELEVLSPLHVGAGGPPLVGGYDVVADAKLGRYYLIDTERLISERMTAEQIAAGVDPKVENLITQGEWDAYARAVLAGPGGPTIAPLVRQHWTLLPFQRDAHGRPYLPGSSLKGALRTALAYALLRDQLRMMEKAGQPVRFADTEAGRLLREQLQSGARREWFARPLETRLFQGSSAFDPNHDLLRAVRISDSEPLRADATVVEQVGIYRRNADKLTLLSDKHRWLVETLPEGTRLALRLDIDTGLFGVQKGLSAEQRDQVGTPFLLHACREFAFRLASSQAATSGSDPTSKFFRELMQRIRQADRGSEAYVQLGWGTGWRAKTIGPLLDLSVVEDGQQTLDELVRRLRLDRTGRGRPFPRTLRLVERNGRPTMPLGWARLRIIPL